MQVYSLAKRIADDPSVNVEIINYEMPVVSSYYKSETSGWRNILKNGIRTNIRMRKRNNIFRSELAHLPLSRESLVSDNYKRALEFIGGRYDVVVVGSDAVWNWNLRGFPNAYMLGSELRCKKMSYAASCHGQMYNDISDEQMSYLRDAWSSYEYIGVRDTSTEDFVRQIDSSLAPVHNCDPTVILDMQAIPISISSLEQKLAKHGINLNKPIIGIMGGENVGRLVRLIYGRKYQIVSLYQSNRFADFFLWNLTPFEWARVFSFFKMTFTSYFHGTLLSIKNGTPTISIENWINYASIYVPKMKDVLDRFGLGHTYFLGSTITPEVITKIKCIADDYLANSHETRLNEAIVKESQSYSSFSTALGAFSNKAP